MGYTSMTCRCGARIPAKCVCINGDAIGIDWITRRMEAHTNARFEAKLRLGNPKDESWNLAGATLKMDVRPKAGGDSILALSSTAGNIIVNDPELRIITIAVDHTQLSGKPAGDWPYDLAVTIAGLIRLRARGIFTIRAGITAP